MRQSRILVLVGLALVAAVGILAWSTRRTEPAPILVNPSAAYPASNFETFPPAELPAYATKPPVRVIQPQQQRTRAYADRTAAPRAPRRVVRERPFSHSAAIVGGGAGAGAAIGAIAGGGKGAAIGALSGGAAGLVYDRLTHR